MENNEQNQEELEVKSLGAFVDSLQRSNKQIKGDRALAIGEDAQMSYGRLILYLLQILLNY